MDLRRFPVKKPPDAIKAAIPHFWGSRFVEAFPRAIFRQWQFLPRESKPTLVNFPSGARRSVLFKGDCGLGCPAENVCKLKNSSPRCNRGQFVGGGGGGGLSVSPAVLLPSDVSLELPFTLMHPKPCQESAHGEESKRRPPEPRPGRGTRLICLVSQLPTKRRATPT